MFYVRSAETIDRSITVVNKYSLQNVTNGSKYGRVSLTQNYYHYILYKSRFIEIIVDIV